jgi:hypothetical protein
MSLQRNPWDLAYELNKEFYTREQIDEMTLSEIAELLENKFCN